MVDVGGREGISDRIGEEGVESKGGEENGAVSISAQKGDVVLAVVEPQEYRSALETLPS